MVIQVILNIGLNVRGDEPPEQLEETIDLIEPLYYFTSYGVDGESEERTVVAIINIDESELISRLEQYCKLLNQTSIAYSGSRIQGIVFNPNYKGKKYRFDSLKFIKITRTGGTKVGI